MIFQFAPLLEYVQVTPQYSNAVLVALMPHVSDAAKQIDVPVPTPITVSAVQQFRCSIIKGDPGGWVTLTNGDVFSFNHGFMQSFTTPHAYFSLQDPARIPEFYGKLRMNSDEAVQFARKNIEKLGHSLESVFADYTPRVTLASGDSTNVVPHYLVEWFDPRSGGQTAIVEVNADAKKVERFYFFGANLAQASLNVSVGPASIKNAPTNDFNPAYGYALLPIVIKSIEDYSKIFDLRVPSPLTTNHLARFKCSDNGGWPHAELELTNGYRFIYRNDRIAGFYAPDSFFDSGNRKIKLREFEGKWQMTEKEAVELARQTIAKFKYHTNFVHTASIPVVRKPQILGKQVIPRYKVVWMFPTPEDMIQWSELEIDAEHKVVKSLYFDDRSFWGHTPKIEVPISLSTNRMKDMVPIQ